MMFHEMDLCSAHVMYMTIHKAGNAEPWVHYAQIHVACKDIHINLVPRPFLSVIKCKGRERKPTFRYGCESRISTLIVAVASCQVYVFSSLHAKCRFSSTYE